MTSRGRCTSIDVAREAGVSQTTVSLVMRGVAQGRVSGDVQQHVRSTAQRLGYRPSVSARNLRTGRAQLLGLVIPDVTDPFFGAVLRGAQDAASSREYTVAMIESFDRGRLEEAVEAIHLHLLDGIILNSPNRQELRVARAAAERVVVIDGGTPRGIANIRYDNTGGMRLIIEHLSEAGHRRLAHVSGAIDRPSFTERRVELERLADGSLVASLQVPFDFDSGLEVVAASFQVLRRATAVVCDTDIHAAMVFSVARSRGLSIPDDLSLVTFNDTPLARALSLTCAAIPAEEAGRVGVQLLLELLAGVPAARRRLAVPLIDRGSVALMRGRARARRRR